MKEKKLHAKFSASGSERWLNCPGSVALSENIPEVESEYAKEGTMAHECLELIMKNNCSDKIILLASKKYPVGMVSNAVGFFDKVISLMPHGSKLLCETRVDLSFVSPGMFGTVDAAIVDIFGTLWVIDYKYGKGRLVSPEENTQMIYYGLGIAHALDFNFENVRLAIAQPRIVHKDGFFRTWDMDVPQLMGWTEKFKEGVKRCKDPFAPFKPGRWCYFCRAQNICPAIENKAFDEAQSDFDL